MVEVPIKRAMIEAADGVVLLADVEKFSARGARARVRRGRARPHRLRRRAARAVPARARGDRDRGHGRVKLTIVGGGGFRVPLVYGALLEKAERLGLDEIVLHDVDAGRLERIAAVLRRPGRRARRAPAVPLDHRARRRRRGRGLRLQRRPRRAARGPRRRRERAARPRRARPGDDRARRDLLRAAHDPGDGRARAGDRRARAEGVADQLHQPRRDGDRGRPAGARGSRDRRLRLALGAVPARRRGGRARRERAVVRLLRPQPPRLAQGRPRPRRRAARRAARGRRAAGRVRGGAAVRRRVAAVARHDPERVPLLLLLRGGHRGGDPREPGVARRVPARAAGPLLRRRGRGPGGRARRVARDAARPRADVHGRGARRGGRRGRARRRRERRLRVRGDGGARGDRAQHARGADPQHRQPEQPPVPRRARGRRGAGDRGPRRSPAGRDRRGPGARPCARDADEGGRAHDDRRRADGIAVARGQGARAAPARAFGERGAGDLRGVSGAVAGAREAFPS